jgi:UDP-N-acetylmuramoyl-tripeptide--D-alanyl-D-alanine ligase
MTEVPPLWTSEEVAKLTGGVSSTNWHATGISIDSRTTEPGDLFIPISGPNFDGHNFIKNALMKGAVASITSRPLENISKDTNLLQVTDTVKALSEMGRGRRTRANAIVIAVTGSVGKTGVKEALGKLLSEQGQTSYSIGSYNNHFGVPLSLARLPKNADYGVFELGMNHAGELTQLSKLVSPNIAIITTVDIAHSEFFHSTDDIARAKAEIFLGLKHGGVAILNRDNQYFSLLRSAALSAGAGNIIGFGRHKESDFKLTGYTANSWGSYVNACFKDEDFKYQLSMPGQHWVYNSLAVLAAIHAAGANTHAAAKSFAKITAFKGRGQTHSIPIQDQHFELIDDSYNACPISVSAAIEVLSFLTPKFNGRRICVFGDMNELGDNSTELHNTLADKIYDAQVDFVYTVGPQMERMCDQLNSKIKVAHAERSEDLIQPLLHLIEPGDILLIKGSANLKMHKVVDYFLKFKNGLDTSPKKHKENPNVI